VLMTKKVRVALPKLILTLAAAFLLVLCPVSEAQTPSTGALVGRVTDSSGAVVPDATVTVSSLATGTTRSVKTDSTGVYKIALLSPGQYAVEVQATNFKTYKTPSVMINVTESEELNMALTVGSTSQTVTVQAETVLAQTESTTLGRVVNEQTVDNLPLVTRNYTQILNLYTGVQADVNNAGALGRNSPDIFVNGGRAIDNDYQMDGVHINNFGTAKAGDWLGYTGIAIPNPDAIEEFKVQTSLYDAGYGRSSGANVNVVTKSGSNAFHGNAFEYFRNNVFNANDFFLKRNGRPRPVLKQNQFGGTFGGPILKDRLFFFASYQGTRQRNGVGANSLQSAFLPPLTNDRSAPTLGQTFCGKSGAQGGVAVACDGSNINPVALALLNQKLPNGTFVIPTPQLIEPNGEGFSVFSNVSAFTEDQVIYNMDFTINKSNILSARYFWSRDPESPAFTNSGSNVPGNGGLDNFGNQSLVVKLVSVLTPSVVNTVTVSGLRNTGSLINLQPTTTTEIGMTGTGQTTVLPQIIVTGLFTLGGNNNDFFDTAVTGFTAGDQISFVHGGHSLRGGFEVDPIRDNFNLFGNKRGSLTFESFPDFLLGMSGAENGSNFSNIFSESAISGITDRQFRVVDYSAYLQDDFKANSQLTFNIGVRWDYYGDVSEARGFMTNFDPALAINPPPAGGTLSGYIVPTNFPKSVLDSVGSPAVMSTGNKGCCGNVQNNFWAPRFGVAWRPFARTDRVVVRAGYGIFYSRLAGNDFLQLLLEPPFNALQSFTGVQNTAATFQVPWNPPLPATPFWPVTFPTSAIAAHSVISNNLSAPLIQQWNLNLQYEFVPGFLWEVGYVGARGERLYGTADLNTPLLASPTNPVNSITTNTVANAQQRVPFVGYTSLLDNETNFDSWYNGLQTSITKRFNHGLQFLGSYTWSKTLDDLSDTTIGFDSGRGGRFPGDGNLARSLEWGPSDFDRAHRFVFSYLWALPQPKERTDFVGKMLSGWQSSGVVTVQSGTPVPIQDQRAGSIIAFRVSGYRYGQVCPGFTDGQLKTPGSVENNLADYLNTAAFCPPPVVGDGFGLGTIGRGAVRGPGQHNVDFAIVKVTPVGWLRENSNIEFRTEFFNAFNTPQFANPASILPLATFGAITATTVAPRIIQFALKYNF